MGEITEAEWEATSRKAQREVAKLKENQEVIADDLIKIRDILSDDHDDEDEKETPRTSADFDELEFLKSVVGTSHTAETKAPAPRGSGPSAKPVTPTSSAAQGDKSTNVTQPIKRATPSAGSTPARASPAGGGAAAAVSPQAAPAAKPESPPAAAKTDAPAAPKKVEKPLAISGPDNALGIKASDVPDQPKTLKCPECGTMNYPSEWYCERCGAELAAI